jgi:LPXTG-motif cell wall-anchored protein
MSSSPSSPPVFSRWVSWLGIVILGAGVSNAPLMGANASGPAAQSSSVQWSGVDIAGGVLQGGTPLTFTTGTRGWTKSAFRSAGTFGLEWEYGGDPARRMEYQGTTETSSFTAGGTSEWTTAGKVSSDPRNAIFVRETVSVVGNTALFTLQLEPIDGDVMAGKRIFWGVALPPGFDSEFSGTEGATLIVTDASNTHPTLVMHATSGAGSVNWGGSDTHTDPLFGGDLAPTVYIHSTSEENYAITITIGVVDRDPCSADAASTFAASKAGVWGETWATITSCLQSPSWTVLADEEATHVVLETGVTTENLAAGETSAVSISGLPSGVSFGVGDSSGTTMTVSMTASRAVAPGTYFPSITRTTETTTEGVVVVSRSDTVIGTLVVGEGDELHAPTQPRSASPTEAPAPEVIPPQPPVLTDPPPPSPSRVITPEVIEAVQPAPDVSPEPSPPATEREPAFLAPRESNIPETGAASAWLGLSLLAVMLTGGLLAYLRRRKLSLGVTDNARE